MKHHTILHRVILCILCIGLFAAILPSRRVSAEALWPEGPGAASDSAIVMELSTGTILYEKNTETSHYPASITKILTTLLAIENCDMDEIVTFSADAVYKNEGNTSHISRDVGEQMTMEECLYGVMLASANECAYAVAEHVGEKLGGDYSTFIELMNRRAQELGCVNTHFNNCNGLPDEEHWTCAYDMALIAREAYVNEEFRRITGTGSYTIPTTNKHSEETILHNHHNMLYPYSTREYLYDYCTGGKTGYTTVAKNTLVTYAEKDGMTLVCVVMYADAPDHYTDTRSLFDFCFSNFQLYNIYNHASELLGGNADAVGILNENPLFVSIGKSTGIVLPKKASVSDVTFQEKEGTGGESSLAELEFFYGEHRVGSGVLEASGAQVSQSIFNMEESGTSGQTVRTITIKIRYLFYAAGAVVVLILLILMIRLIADRIYRAKRDRRMRRFMSDKYGSGTKRRRRRKRDRLFR